MRITFDNITVIKVEQAVSAKGRPYGKLQMLTDSLDVYDLFVPAAKVSCLDSLKPHTQMQNVPFDLVAGYNGGVQLIPAWGGNE